MSGAYLGDYYAIAGLLKYYDKMPKRIVICVAPWSFMRTPDDGRHSSLKPYSLYMMDSLGIAPAAAQEKEWFSKKFKELFSFSYFQASVDYYKDNGIKKMEEDVRVVPNAQITELQKINLDGRLIPSSKEFQTLNEIEQTVQYVINSGSVYQIKTGYKDIQEENVAKFEALLQYWQDNGVEVHIYLPAWHPGIYEYFCENEAFAGVNKLELAMREYGRKHNIPVHGGYDPSICNITAEDFMDWLHLKPEKMLENYKYVKG